MRSLLLAVVCAAFAATPAAAQLAATDAAAPAAPTIPGWVFTPSMTYAAGWDDNVLLRGVGDNVQGDLLNTVGPGAAVSYNGKRTQFDASYGGGFQLYRDLNTLDAYTQSAALSARRLVTKRLTLFARNSYTAMPTTQVLELVGVPYVRAGSQMETAEGGVDYLVSKRLSMEAAYNFQWVKFDASAFGIALFGGHSQGARYAIKYQLNDLTALTGNADVQLATINGNIGFVPAPPVTAGVLANDFQTENASAGVDRRLSETLHVYGELGVSHLAISALFPSRTGPAWHAGLKDSFGQTSFAVDYSRSFVPSFGFGGTLQNEELSAGARRPITRRSYASGVFAWMRNQPLVPGQLSLDSLWVAGTVGYVVNQWARLEVFYAGIHQTIDQPGGILNHNQFGVQIVTAKPMRIK